MYLSSEIGNWFPTAQSWTAVDDWKTPYATIDHAEAVLLTGNTDHHRADAVVNLKRAVDSRIRHLDDIYRFKRLPLPRDVDGIYDRMSYLGLIRPKMLGKLYELRNAIEHRDEKAPELQRCFELLEFAWYFLKSTDHIAQLVVSDIVLRRSERDDSDYWLEVSFEDEDLFHFRGWIPNEFVSNITVSGWYGVKMEQCETKADVRGRVTIPSEVDHTAKFRDEDFCVHGVFMEPNSKCDLYRWYFQC
jgi:hypothetical protein